MAAQRWSVDAAQDPADGHGFERPEGGAMYYSAITASFSAAHALRNYQGKCERLHGHNWKIEVLTATETLDAAGMGLDFTVLRERLGAVLAHSTTASSTTSSPSRPAAPPRN